MTETDKQFSHSRASVLPFEYRTLNYKDFDFLSRNPVF